MTHGVQPGGEGAASSGGATPERLVEGRFVDLARHAWDFQRDPIRFFTAIRDAYGPTVLFPRPRYGPRLLRPLVVTCDPQLMRRVLTHPAFRNSALALSGPRGSSHRRIRHSLLRMHGEEHRHHRSLIAPTLHRKASLDYVDTMTRVVDTLIDAWRPPEQRDLAADMKEIALHISATTLFGLKDPEESSRIGHMIEEWWSDNFKLLLRIAPWNLPGTPFRRMLHKAEHLERLVGAVIEDKRAEAASGAAGNNMLAQLIRACDEQGGMSEAELLGQTHILFLAAHETTTYALTWTLFLLAQHPAAAERVCAEIDEVLGDAPLGADRLDSLPELSRAIDESLRILPIVPFGSRIAEEAVDLGGLALPRKARFLMPYHLLHHDAAVFPDPRRFEPDRWIDFEPPPYTYLPFSAGLHMCVGTSFAKTTMLVVLARLLQRFRFEVCAGARIDRRLAVTMAPVGGLPVRLLSKDAAWRRTPVSGSVRDLVELGPTR